MALLSFYFMDKGSLGAVLLFLGLASVFPAGAAPGRFVTTVPVTGGLADPIGVTSAGDGSGRLFILERPGRIRIWNGSQLLPAPFLDIESLIQCGACGERGLLGLAFHPDYESNGRFFVFYTRTDGDLVIAGYEVSADPDVADPASGDVLLRIEHSSQGNHNGGQLAFGPDGYLYAGTGDGGGGGDPFENGQDVDSLLGKILRLDVDGGDGFPADPERDYAIPPTNPFVGVPGADEVWAYGLRNPWRFGFDRLTGDLYIGDVGQNEFEEIDFQPWTSPGGENYGWDCREGMHDFPDANGDNNAGCDAVVSVDPVLEYSHALGCSVTGGFVFRNLPHHSLFGSYLYGDFCSGILWRGVRDAGGDWTSETLPVSAGGFNLTSFGENEKGRVYFTNLSSNTLRWLAPYSFLDVPPTYFAWPFVEAIFGAGITSGCGGDAFCPDSTVTRAEMAVFLLRAKHGPAYVPPPATGTVFADVAAGSFAAAYIEQLFQEGVTTGCGGGNFCPGSPVTRDQMAVFLLLAREGSGYVPPACAPLFADVPCSSPFAPWVDELARRGITGGCGGGNFCPALAVSRGQMAVFLATAFGLPTP